MKDKAIIVTERCILLKFSKADAKNMFELNADPKVIQYTGDPPFESLEAAQKFIAEYNQYALYGMGRWSVYDKTTNNYLGWCGLKYHPEENLVDLGYRFHKKYWNQGFATECARACLQYGFEKLNLESIVAHAMVDNKASYRVMEKIGMEFKKNIEMEGHPAVLYIVKKEDWL